MKLTYLKATENGGYSICQPVKNLGWQNPLAYVIAISHGDDVTPQEARAAAYQTSILLPSDGAPNEEWIYDYAEMGMGKIAKRGRPPKGNSGAEAQIHLRVEMARKSAYVKAAQAEGLGLSEWMLKAADVALSRGVD